MVHGGMEFFLICVLLQLQVLTLCNMNVHMQNIIFAVSKASLNVLFNTSIGKHHDGMHVGVRLAVLTI